MEAVFKFSKALTTETPERWYPIMTDVHNIFFSENDMELIKKCHHVLHNKLVEAEFKPKLDYSFNECYGLAAIVYLEFEDDIEESYFILWASGGVKVTVEDS